MKPKERKEARRLRRKKGESVGEIAKMLNVSKGTVSIWVRDIELTKEQIEKLKLRNPIYNNQFLGAKARKLKARKIRKEYQKKGRTKARDSGMLHLIGCMLYWGEGTKHKNNMQFCNSDIRMMQIFMLFLKNEYDITNDKVTFRVSCYLNNGLTLSEIENYWLAKLNLPRACLRKSIVNSYPKSSQRKKRKNKLKYGTGTITVCSTELVQNIFGAITEYAYINKPIHLN